MPFFVLLLIALVIYMLVMPAVAAARASRALKEMERLRHQVRLLQAELARQGQKAPPGDQTEGSENDPVPVPAVIQPALRAARTMSAEDVVAAGRMDYLLKAKMAAAVPPPLPVRPVAAPPLELQSRPVEEGPPSTPASPAREDVPPPPVVSPAWEKPREAEPVPAPKPPVEFNLEQFMGVKLFAWLGGLALFIGIVLFVKYAFEQDLVPPGVRTVTGAIIGLALALIGARLRESERYRVLAHTLAATGVLILYGVSFAGHMLYDLYNQGSAFAMAATITAGAFFLAVRMEARAVAVLGMLGGFLAPVLLSTGVDKPLALFGYIAALDAGILALVHIRDWRRLTALAAGGTGIMVLGWLLKFWTKSEYAFGNATFVPAAALLFFPALFCAAGWWLTRRTERSLETLASAAGLSWLALLLCFAGQDVPSLADRPWLLFGFVFLQYGLTGAAAWREARLMPVCMTAGAAVFLLLAVWARRSLTAGLLPHALALFLIFGAMQTAFPLLWRRAQKEPEPLPSATVWMPLPVLLLLLIGVLRVPEATTGIWLTILTVNVLLLVLGKVARKAEPAVAGMGLTMVTLLAWMMLILKEPALRTSLASSVLPVMAGFAVVLTAGGLWLRRQWEGEETGLQDSRMMAAVVPAVGGVLLLIIAMVVLPATSLVALPWLVFGLIFGQYALTSAAVARDRGLMPVSIAAGVALFLLLALWSGRVLTPDLLPFALTLFVIFGVLQTVFPLLWRRTDNGGELPPAAAAAGWMPLPVLALLLIGVLRVPGATTGIWLAALLVNGALLALGKRSRQAAPVLAGSCVTMALLYGWLMMLLNRPDLRPIPGNFFLAVLAAFATLLTAGGLWLYRQWDEEAEDPLSSRPLAPVAPALLSFPLLLLATVSLPEPPFGGIAAIMLGLATMVMYSATVVRQWRLFPVALGAVFCLELALHNKAWDVRDAGRLAWYLAAWVLFLGFPFLRRALTRGHVLPWITAALSGVVQFILLYDTALSAWPDMQPGLIPALCALPPALVLRLLYVDRSTDPEIRLSQLAWFGGVVLLFLTLIVPVQWERHWLTLGWALEGAALCWLYRRVPHDGLRLTGAVLLVTAFVRLAFNQATLTYYPRTYPIWNWQLYTYGLAIAAHIAAVRFLDPPRHMLRDFPLRVLFQAQAGVLIFVLINLEIADYFTPSGSPYISWPFEGYLARDMTLTIAWGLYSFALVAWGLWKRSRGARYAGVGLMGITLLKLFIFDLAGIHSLYRIAVTITVALIALGVSFLYQRFAARLVREEL
jgi:uncharacterized membrane protein